MNDFFSIPIHPPGFDRDFQEDLKKLLVKHYPSFTPTYITVDNGGWVRGMAAYRLSLTLVETLALEELP